MRETELPLPKFALFRKETVRGMYLFARAAVNPNWVFLSARNSDYGSPSGAMNLSAQFDKLPDGPSRPATIEGASKRLTMNTQNSVSGAESARRGC